MDHPPYKPKMVEEEFQIEQLLDMGFSEFKATMLEYKKRLDMGLLHSKAEIAKLEGYIQILKRKIVELENEKAQVREIVKEKK